MTCSECHGVMERIITSDNALIPEFTPSARILEYDKSRRLQRVEHSESARRAGPALTSVTPYLCRNSRCNATRGAVAS